MTKLRALILPALLLGGAISASAQSHEIGLLLGGNTTGDRELRSPQPGSVRIGAGLTYYANYAYRFAGFKALSVHLEVPFAAAPSADLRSSNVTVPRNYASLFITPGIKVKFLPDSNISPYAVVGGGFGRFEESAFRIDNQPNLGPRGTNRGVFDFGGGLDLNLLRFLSIRGEVRDFVSGSPNLNVQLSRSRQHNLLSSGGIVFRF